METIYKGLNYALSISIEVSDGTIEQDSIAVSLHNKATKTVINAIVVGIEHLTFGVLWSAEQTAELPIGIYALDVIDKATNEMLYHSENFARCVVSSQKVD